MAGRDVENNKQRQKERRIKLSLVFFSSSLRGAGGRLKKVIEARFPGKKIQACKTVDSLLARLHEPKCDLDLAILLAKDLEELRRLVSIGDLFDDLRIILILPNRDEEAIKDGHRLRPRFLTYADGDFKDVAAVLNNMFKKNLSTRIQEIRNAHAVH
jgi:hypothetical protein